ncbi:MAG: hypothetical protein QW358_04775 [Candidatus Hadarchaeum sp.]
MIEKIEHDGKLFAIILRSGFEMDGVNFFTPEDNPLQLGVLKYEKGVEIRPHVHKNSVKTIKKIQEVLHIMYGKIEASFYNITGEKVGSSILNVGDTILLLDGGHGFRILENSKILEIKQGPYLGPDKDKERL